MPDRPTLPNVFGPVNRTRAQAPPANSPRISRRLEPTGRTQEFPLGLVALEPVPYPNAGVRGSLHLAASSGASSPSSAAPAASFLTAPSCTFDGRRRALRFEVGPDLPISGYHADDRRARPVGPRADG